MKGIIVKTDEGRFKISLDNGFMVIEDDIKVVVKKTETVAPKQPKRKIYNNGDRLKRGTLEYKGVVKTDFFKEISSKVEVNKTYSSRSSGKTYYYTGMEVLAKMEEAILNRRRNVLAASKSSGKVRYIANKDRETDDLTGSTNLDKEETITPEIVDNYDGLAKLNQDTEY